MKVTTAPERRYWTVVAAAIGLNLAITVPLAAVLNTWVDESSTLRTTSGSLLYAVHQAIHYELQPPLYYALLDVWRHLDPSIFFARLFSVLCVALTLLVMAQLLRRFAPDVHPVWVVAIAIHPAIIWAAEEIRVYAFLGLISALLLRTLYDGYLASPGSRAARVAHVVLAIAALYTQYFLLFYIAAALCTLALTRRFDALRAYLRAVGVMAVAGLPIALIVRSQISTGTALYVSTSGPIALVRQLYTAMFCYIIPIQWLRIGVPEFVILGAAGAVALIYVHRRSSTPVEWQAPWLFTTIVSVLMLCALYVSKEPFGARYVFVVFVPAMLAVLCSIIRAGPSRRQLLSGWIALLLICSTVLLIRTYAPLAKRGDWRRVAAFLVSTERPNQPILAFQSENAVTLQDYYHGSNRVIAVPHSIDFDNVAYAGVILHDSREVRAALDQAPGDHPLIWAVTTSECSYQNVDYHCPIFEAYLAKHYAVVQERQFFGSRVRLLRERAAQ